MRLEAGVAEANGHVMSNGDVVLSNGDAHSDHHHDNQRPVKLIIDTDPGVDDALALFMAFQRSDLYKVVALTTIFGNVHTPLATQNALRLVERAGAAAEGVAVVQGALGPLGDGIVKRVADFVHGKDGLGNTFPSPPSGTPLPGTSAAQYLVDAANASPGELTVLALGPLTNLALALRIDPNWPKKVKKIVVLGGAFFVNGNVNPAAEANIAGDAEAADIVFGCGENVYVVGLNVTTEVYLTDKDLDHIKESNSKHGAYCHEICQFYMGYHKTAFGLPGVYLHDPTALVAITHPHLFTWAHGAVRVVTEGLAHGETIMDAGGKNWYVENPWMGRPAIAVAVKVQAPEVVQLVKESLMQQ
eukprot:jgi/Chlat1/3155/Chrsp219S03302